MVDVDGVKRGKENRRDFPSTFDTFVAMDDDVDKQNAREHDAASFGCMDRTPRKSGVRGLWLSLEHVSERLLGGIGGD